MIYTANSTVTVEGKSYRPGDSVDIQDASAAKELLAVGFIVTLPGEYPQHPRVRHRRPVHHLLLTDWRYKT